MTEFYLIRHGDTSANKGVNTSDDRIRGHTDEPLSQEGIKHAEQTATRLKAKNIEVIECSDIKRALQTAEIIGKALNIKPIPNQSLRSWDRGNLVGQPLEAALPFVEDPDQTPPQGESFNTFKQRAFQGLAQAITRAQGKRLAIITHHNNERLYKAWIAAGQKKTGEIDLDVFTEKGEKPGAEELLSLRDTNLRQMTKETPKQTIQRSMNINA
jgi:uncharacterized phosphatase